MSRGTKCFSAQSESKYPGSYPVGFLKWVKDSGWWGDKRIHLCAGGVIDADSDRVDIQQICTTPSKRHQAKGKLAPEKRGLTYRTTANIIADARDTGLDAESYNWVGIDPPYTSELAARLYDTEEAYSSINAFVKEGWRLLEPGGYLMTFSYEICKRPGEDATMIASWGIYTTPAVRFMTALTVWRKDGDSGPQGLDRFLE